MGPAAGRRRVTRTVAIIDYGSGNLRSAQKAFERASRETEAGATILVTADPEAVRAADRIVLPGVGAFADCRAGLDAVTGMVEALEERVIRGGAPFLGICVGMQLLAEVGREHGDHKGLGWIPGDVVRISPRDPSLKIPHMGWNSLALNATHPMTGGMSASDVYFVHSYCIRPSNRAHVLATTDYGGEIAAIVGRDNIIGTQFHLEKSQAAGLRLLSNFVQWRP